MGDAWSPPAFQVCHTILVGVWGGGSPSGGSGADGCVPTAGCTFEEDSDPNQCEFSQGEDDDFDWELLRSYLMPHLTPDLPHGESGVPPCPWGSLPCPCVLYPRAGRCASSWFNSCNFLDLTSPYLHGKWEKKSVSGFFKCGEGLVS